MMSQSSNSTSFRGDPASTDSSSPRYSRTTPTRETTRQLSPIAGRSVPTRSTTDGISPQHSSARRIEILRTASTVTATTGLRTSLQQIADAAGITAGSLYHHFESKEALFVELIRRYHADLDRIGDVALKRIEESRRRPMADHITTLVCEIARCAVEHRAALQMSFYQDLNNDPELVHLARRRPAKIQAAMLHILRIGPRNGYTRPDFDLPTVADRICQSILYAGLDPVYHSASVDKLAKLKTQILMEGLAVDSPADADLDKSEAFALAENVIETWLHHRDDADTKVSHLLAVARNEFGRRGYEMTTVRDIAAAAGLCTGTVYELIGSKDELLMSIMLEFGRKVGCAWTEIVRSDSTTVEKLDALTWLNINALNQFPDEFRIQLAWLRQKPPDTSTPIAPFTTRIWQMTALLAEGIRAGDIRTPSTSPELLARCIIGEQWVPENILGDLGTRHSLRLTRDTNLRGITARHV